VAPVQSGGGGGGGARGSLVPFEQVGALKDWRLGGMSDGVSGEMQFEASEMLAGCSLLIVPTWGGRGGGGGNDLMQTDLGDFIVLCFTYYSMFLE